MSSDRLSFKIGVEGLREGHNWKRKRQNTENGAYTTNNFSEAGYGIIIAVPDGTNCNQTPPESIWDASKMASSHSKICVEHRAGGQNNNHKQKQHHHLQFVETLA